MICCTKRALWLLCGESLGSNYKRPSERQCLWGPRIVTVTIERSEWVQDTI
jgi:hypothetical protein